MTAQFSSWPMAAAGSPRSPRSTPPLGGPGRLAAGHLRRIRAPEIGGDVANCGAVGGRLPAALVGRRPAGRRCRSGPTRRIAGGKRAAPAAGETTAATTRFAGVRTPAQTPTEVSGISLAGFAGNGA